MKQKPKQPSLLHPRQYGTLRDSSPFGPKRPTLRLLAAALGACLIFASCRSATAPTPSVQSNSDYSGTWGADSEYVLIMRPTSATFTQHFSSEMPAQDDSIFSTSGSNIAITFASSDTVIGGSHLHYPWVRLNLTSFTNDQHDSLAGKIYFGDTVAYHICFVRE